ncbi:MAG: hypothetical protein MUF49_17910 [Oculatellaceae cyanobacterium Prado106]|jgi:hypothetical protein|nr:hypothetical protein [Oculatellaceae cyanobacterium Prado106]
MTQIQLVAVEVERSAAPQPVEASPSPMTTGIWLGALLGLSSLLGFMAIFAEVVWEAVKHRKESQRVYSKANLTSSEIPCRNCKYFKKNLYLKCAVHPSAVMTSDAIGCADYCSATTRKGRSPLSPD